jgi:hypothetical protein
MAVLDKVCEQEKYKEALFAALDKKCMEDPEAFFNEYIIPLTPRHHDVAISGLETGPTHMTPDQIVLSMYRTVVPVAGVRLRLKTRPTMTDEVDDPGDEE